MTDETERFSAVMLAFESGIVGRPVRVKAGAQKARLLLLLSALENGKAFLQVLGGPCSFASVANARSAFEALMDFRVLENDPAYLKSMECTFLKQKKSALASAIKAAKRFTPNDKQKILVAERDLAETAKRIAALPKMPKRSKAELLIEHVDNTGAILALWSILCDVSHNNINSLAIRHLPLSDEGRESLTINAEIEPQLVEVLCSILRSMFEDARPFWESCFVDPSV